MQHLEHQLMVLLVGTIYGASSQSDFDNWPPQWFRNSTERCFGPMVNASCAELNEYFTYETNPDGSGFLWAQPYANASGAGATEAQNHQTCGADGITVAGPAGAGNAVCGFASFRLYCSVDTYVNFRGFTQRAQGARSGNDDSFWASIDDRIYTSTWHVIQPQAPVWGAARLAFPTNILLRAGPHTFNVAEREDGTRIRNVIMTAGYPDCSFGAPEPTATDIMQRVMELETATNDRVGQTELDVIALQDAVSSIQQTLSGMTDAMSTMQSSLNAQQSAIPRFTVSRGNRINSPVVEASGRDVNVAGRTVKVTSEQCGETDICELATAVKDITNALRGI